MARYVSINSITEIQAVSLINSKEQFPVNFDHAWQWIGYFKKQEAKTLLVSNFDEGIDFSRELVKTPQGGRPRELFMLSLDCFKSFCMMAGTAKGKEVRKYFLQCEKQLKQNHTNTYLDRLTKADSLRLPAGYWCIFAESTNLINKIARKYPIGVYDCVDGSIGIMWSKYRKDKDWTVEAKKYPYQFPDKRNWQNPKCYAYAELPYFRKWYDEIYQPLHLPGYLSKKYSNALIPQQPSLLSFN